MESLVTTSVFTNGMSQAVRIPKEFRFNEDEIVINKIGDTVLLTPKSALADSVRLVASLLPDDFMENGMPKSIPAVREEI